MTFRISAFIFLLFSQFLISQYQQTGPLSCINPNGNYTPPDSIEHCKSGITSDFDSNWLERIEANGGISQAGIKSVSKKRSVFVNESINKTGGFAVFQSVDNDSQAKMDPDAVGSTFAIDEDGDGIYEREDKLLNKLYSNLIDEIILYNIADILEKGDRMLVSGTGSQSIFENKLSEEQTVNWHLARFIKKAKNKGFEVVAIVPDGIEDNYQKFKDFHHNYGESDNGSSSFDGHFFEIEWWDSSNHLNAEEDYEELTHILEFSDSIRNSDFYEYYPSSYVAQNQVDKPEAWSEWLSLTAQERADKIDSLTDRIYIYAYQRVPCDCYWGLSNGTTLNKTENDWYKKVSYFKNNEFQTDIYPVFNAKYYDSLQFENDRPSYFSDGNYGCNSNDDDCDFCYNKVGDIMRRLPNTADGIRLGYVENIWQEQFDFDHSTDEEISINIQGYSWFKSSVLDGAGVILSDTTTIVPKDTTLTPIDSTTSVKNQMEKSTNISPNPSSKEVFIESDFEISKVEIVNISGQIILTSKGDNIKSVILNQNGTYFFKVYMKDSIFVRKVIIYN